MLYDLADPSDAKKLTARLARLIAKAGGLPRGESLWMDVTEKTRQTTNQNNFLHLCCEFLGLHLGVSKECVKNDYFKKLANPDLFVYRETDKYGRTFECLRHSSDLTKEEMTQAIDNFRLWCLDNCDGFDFPDADDYNDCMRLQKFCERLRGQQ